MSQNLGVDSYNVDCTLLIASAAGNQSRIYGFEEWLDFAKENKCHLGKYEQIEKDLKVSSTCSSHGVALIPQPISVSSVRRSHQFAMLIDSIQNHWQCATDLAADCMYLCTS